MRTLLNRLALVFVALAFSCSSDPSSPSDTGVDVRDVGSLDASTADTGPGDTGPGDVGSDVGSDIGSDVGTEVVPSEVFDIRVPQERTVPCDDMFNCYPKAVDRDHVCKIVHPTLNALIYVRANPVRFTWGTQFETAGAWINENGVTSPLDGNYFDGGNHRNDSFRFTRGDWDFRLYHSSFGWGWRSCHPMDCMELSQGAALVEEGCTRERTLPIVCVAVQRDGSVPPLVDSFSRCDGDLE